MSDITKRIEHGGGPLSALDLHRLLIGVPDEAVIEISQEDPDRGQGEGWHFTARWPV